MPKNEFKEAIDRAGSRKWNWVYFGVIMANVIYVLVFFLLNLTY